MIAVDLITGFLGAGKTTFVNKLAAYYMRRGEKIAYVANDFGSVCIDASLADGVDMPVFALEGGCICCSLRQGFAAVLNRIAGLGSVERVVIEPSGIFMPDEFEELLKSEAFKNLFFVENKICIVDCLHYKKLPHTAGSFVDSQIKRSDILVLSKTQLCEDEKAVADEITKIHPDALLYAKPWDELDDTALMELLLKPASQPEGCPHHGHMHFETCTVSPKAITNEAYRNFVNVLRRGELGGVIRAKGFLPIDETMHIFQYAFGTAVLIKTEKTEKPVLSFIGSGIKSGEIKAIFNA